VKTLLIRSSQRRFLPDSIDLGWRVIDREGQPWETWWGNCKDEAALQSCIRDLRSRGNEFEIEDQRGASAAAVPGPRGGEEE
jgi:hypothetical protein